MLATARHPVAPTPAATARLAVKALAAGAGVQKGRLQLPASFVICPWGESKDLDGAPVIVNQTTLTELPVNQAAAGFDEVALDFNHNTTPKFDGDGKPVPLAEPLPIAGMGSLSVKEGVGIIYTPVSWTPEGEAAFTGRHYRDLSPTVGKNEKGEVIFVHSVALTRAGQISGLHAYAAGASISFSQLSSHTSQLSTTMDFRTLLATLLNLDPATATDEEISAAAGSFNPKPQSAPEQKPEVKPEAKPSEMSELSARLDGIERDALVREATAAGKVIPLSADQIKATPLPVLKALCAGLPGTVPLTKPKETPEPATSLKPLSAEETEVCKQLGLTPEQFHKANA